jgi:O-antigen ligase
VLARAAEFSLLLLFASLPWSIAPMSIAATLCITLTLADGAARREMDWLKTPVLIPGLGWLLALGVAALVGNAGIWHPLTKAVLLLLVPVVAYHAREERIGRAVLVVLFASALIATAYALAEFLARGGVFPARVRGAVGHPLTYGGQVLLLMSLALAIAARARERRWRLGAVGLLLLLLPALLGSYTRSAWLGVVTAAATIVALTRARWLLALAAVVAVGLTVLPAGYRERALSSFDPASRWNVERVHMWEAGVRMFRDHPITGVGLQDFAKVYERYKSPDAHERAGHLHSVWFHVAATMGVIGLVALVALIVGLFRAAGRGLRARLRDRASPQERRIWISSAIRLGVVAGLAGFLVAGLFEWNFGDEELLDLLYSLVGLAYATRNWRLPSGGDEHADIRG